MSEFLDIIYEDDVVLVCNKPAGLMVEPDRNNHPNLLQEVKKYLKDKNPNEAVYVQHLHRLDRPVSGLVLFTKNKEHLRYLSEQFAQRTIEKYYYALTVNTPLQKKATLENWHRKEKKKGRIVDAGTEFAEVVKLDYDISNYDDKFLWNIKLHTGKFHQIRAQLSHIGCPIIGDKLYDSETDYHLNTIALQAYKLNFNHPVTKQTIALELKFNL